MQWQGKSTNLSSNQVRGTVNLAFQYIMKQRKLNLWTPAKSYENLEHHFKSLQYNNNRVDNLKKLKTEIKKSIEEKYKNVVKRLTARNEWQRKMSCGYINRDWSFKLVDSTSSYRIWIRII